jgi:cell division protein FtsL
MKNGWDLVDGGTKPRRSIKQLTGAVFHRVRDGVRFKGLGTFMTVVLTVSLLLVGLFYVWTRMRIVQVRYEIAEQEKISRVWKKRQQELLLEIASLESPADLERKAREEAGLIFPDIRKVHHVP